MFEYALSRSYEELKSVISSASTDLNNEGLKKEVNYRVGSFLHWCMDYYERLEKNANICENHKSFFSGLRYANNKLKHDTSIIQVYRRTGGFSFPISFPFSMPSIEFKWYAFQYETNKKYINQFNNYKLFISDKQIIEIADKVLIIIKEYSY